jgi:lipoprotein Spr
MLYLKFYIIVLFSSAALLIYTGCSSSSGTVRYNKDEETEEEYDNVRFTDENDNNDPESNTSTTDLNEEETTDDLPDEEPSVDISSVFRNLDNNSNVTDMSADNSTVKEKVLMEIIKYLNTPYKYGGNSKNGIDCSAFTQTIYNNTLSIPLLRSAREQYQQGIVINNKEELKFGDLVFFNTRRRVKPGHVGIYIGENLFAHASSKKGVIVSSLDHDYYSRKYMGARRIENLP